MQTPKKYLSLIQYLPLLIVLLIIAIVSSHNFAKQNHSKNETIAGTFSDNCYSNEVLGIEITIPDEWSSELYSIKNNHTGRIFVAYPSSKLALLSIDFLEVKSPNSISLNDLIHSNIEGAKTFYHSSDKSHIGNIKSNLINSKEVLSIEYTGYLNDTYDFALVSKSFFYKEDTYIVKIEASFYSDSQEDQISINEILNSLNIH